MPRKKLLKPIEEPTTHKADYTWPELKCTLSLVGVQERVEPRTKPPPPPQVIDWETHDEFDAYVPFDMFIGKKDIVGKDPREPFSLKNWPKVENIRKTRPRMIMTPQIPLDDVESEGMYDFMVKYMYDPEKEKYLREAALPVPPPPPLPNTVMSTNIQTRYKGELYHCLPEGWILAAKHWDSLQSRFLGDPFKTFWKRKAQDIECGCCENPIPRMLEPALKKYIRELSEEGKLRQAYDIPILSYAGYRPVVGKGVLLENKPGFGLN